MQVIVVCCGGRLESSIFTTRGHEEVMVVGLRLLLWLWGGREERGTAVVSLSMPEGCAPARREEAGLTLGRG